MHSRIALAAANSSLSGPRAMMHSRVVLDNSSASASASVVPGHPVKMISSVEFFKSAPPSELLGHPDMMHSKEKDLPRKSCLKKAPSTGVSSAAAPFARYKKKKVHFPSALDKLSQANSFKSKNAAMLWAPIRYGPQRFITNVPGPGSRPRFESRPAIAWSGVQRAMAFKSTPLASTRPVDFARRSVLATSKSQYVPAPTSQVPVYRLLPVTSNASLNVSKSVDFAPQPVLPTIKPQDVFAPKSSKAVVRLPSRVLVIESKVGLSMPAHWPYLLAMLLFLGFCYPDLWFVLLIIFVGYMITQQ